MSQLLNPSPACRGADHLPKMSFVEVSDTRVSRLHCVIKLEAPTDASTAPQALLEDHSSNGTYVDDVRVRQGEAVVLSSGSKVSLVRSVTPWVERCFTFWEGMLAFYLQLEAMYMHSVVSSTFKIPGGGVIDGQYPSNY